MPTDTIYGLVALATNRKSVARMYGLKKREKKPGTLIAANVDQLIKLGLDEKSLRLAAGLWPNPLSVIIATSPRLRYLDQGLGDLAVRIPAHDELRRLLEKTGPLVTSSANHPGEQPANNVRGAQEYFGAAVDFYADGGDLAGRPPSTVARLSGGRLQILRQGAAVIGDSNGLSVK